MKKKRRFLVLTFMVLVLCFSLIRITGEIDEMECYGHAQSFEIPGNEENEENEEKRQYISISEEKEERKKEYIGRFELTAYCPCENCSGEYGNMTATGKVAKEGRTVAVDPKVIPYGTEIVIGDEAYIAEDCGGAIKGKAIDIFFESHQEAKEFGRRKSNIFILEKEL